MATMYKHLKPTPRLVTFIRHKLHELKCQLVLVTDEIEAYEDILTRISRCSDCDGRGEVTVVAPDGDGHCYKTCPNCNGMGEENG